MRGSIIVNVSLLILLLTGCDSSSGTISDGGELSQLSYAEDCMDTAMTQRDINACAFQKSQAAESMLSKLETEIKSVLDTEAQEKFVKAQKAWEIVVSNDCDIESGFFSGGSIESTIYSSCKEHHIKQRIEKIRYFLCPSWSVTGSCPAVSKYSV